MHGSHPHIPRRSRRLLRSAISSALIATALVASGCNLFGIVGVMARTFERTGSTIIAAEYEGLRDNSFAVVVFADRSIQGVHPQLVTRVSQLVTQRLANTQNTGASGFVPAPLILEFQLTTPSWTSWTYDQLAEEFGVDRLIVVDIFEFRLNQPGNQYVWDGLASARIGVVESESALPDDFVYSKQIRVGYPDGQGYSRDDFTREHVYGFLERRLVDRLSWLFYEHEEANAIEY